MSLSYNSDPADAEPEVLTNVDLLTGLNVKANVENEDSTKRAKELDDGHGEGTVVVPPGAESLLDFIESSLQTHEETKGTGAALSQAMTAGDNETSIAEISSPLRSQSVLTTADRTPLLEEIDAVFETYTPPLPEHENITQLDADGIGAQLLDTDNIVEDIGEGEGNDADNDSPLPAEQNFHRSGKNDEITKKGEREDSCWVQLKPNVAQEVFWESTAMHSAAENVDVENIIIDQGVVTSTTAALNLEDSASMLLLTLRHSDECASSSTLLLRRSVDRPNDIRVLYSDLASVTGKSPVRLRGFLQSSQTLGAPVNLAKWPLSSCLEVAGLDQYPLLFDFFQHRASLKELCCVPGMAQKLKQMYGVGEMLAISEGRRALIRDGQDFVELARFARTQVPAARFMTAFEAYHAGVTWADMINIYDEKSLFNLLSVKQLLNLGAIGGVTEYLEFFSGGDTREAIRDVVNHFGLPSLLKALRASSIWKRPAYQAYALSPQMELRTEDFLAAWGDELTIKRLGWDECVSRANDRYTIEIRLQSALVHQEQDRDTKEHAPKTMLHKLCPVRSSSIPKLFLMLIPLSVPALWNAYSVLAQFSDIVSDDL